MLDKLVFKEVDECSLVTAPRLSARGYVWPASFYELSLSQVISPIMFCNLTGAVMPRLQVFALRLVHMGQVVGIGAQDVGGTEDMRRVVVEAQVVVDDAVIDVICLEKVFQRPRSLLRPLFDIVDVCLGDLDAASEESKGGELRQLELQHGDGIR